MMSLPTTRVIASTVDEPPCDGRTDGQTDRLGGGCCCWRTSVDIILIMRWNYICLLINYEKTVRRITPAYSTVCLSGTLCYTKTTCIAYTPKHCTANYTVFERTKISSKTVDEFWMTVPNSARKCFKRRNYWSLNLDNNKITSAFKLCTVDYSCIRTLIKTVLFWKRRISLLTENRDFFATSLPDR